MARNQIFKHMMPRDIPPFVSYFLSDEGQHYTSWEFDVIIGKPNEPGAMFPRNLRAQAMYLNALKIDAIGWLFSTPTLIEAKPDADLGALGQIDGYADWYRLTYGVYPRKMIVCESMREQVQLICPYHNIEVRICPPADELTVARAERMIVPLIQPSPLFPNPLRIPR